VIRAPVLLKYWLPVVVWMALIFSASSDSQSGQRSSCIIGPILRWLNPNISEIATDRVVAIVRKVAHVTEYALLAVLLWRARRGTCGLRGVGWNRYHARFAFIVTVLYSITDELHQMLVPNRGPSLGDVLLDSAGGLLGLFVLWLWFLLRPVRVDDTDIRINNRSK
jgi:VanZ family protein